MILKADNVAFSYKKEKTLKGVSFSANEGDFVCVLGCNGCGKTTLFKCLLGIYKADSGDIFVNSKSIKKFSTKELAKEIAYIPQAHIPSFNYKVIDAVLMGRNAYVDSFKSPKKEDEEKAYDALNRLGIGYLAEKGYSEISGGERQLVLIARAITQNSKILLMDEPTSNLDYGNQMLVLQEVKKLSQDGYTVIMSTHNPDHAFMFANKAVIIKDGKVLCEGDPLEIMNSDVLKKIYNIDLDLIDIKSKHGKEFKVCLPS